MLEGYCPRQCIWYQHALLLIKRRFASFASEIFNNIYADWKFGEVAKIPLAKYPPPALRRKAVGHAALHNSVRPQQTGGAGWHKLAPANVLEFHRRTLAANDVG